MNDSNPMPPNSPGRFTYAAYEAAIRGPDYERLRAFSADLAEQFRDCNSVLDIASGQGFLLDALKNIGVSATGVDNEPELIQDCLTRGLNVVEEDALRFLAETSDRFDGAYCGHIIEHLPFEALIDLFEGVHHVLSPGGKFIVRWPNSRSGLTVFHAYWKDPTHVRFYDGDFVKAILQFYGFDVIESHYDTVAPRTEQSALHTDEAVGAPEKLAAPQPPPRKRSPVWRLGELGRRVLTKPLRLDQLTSRMEKLEATVGALQQHSQEPSTVSSKLVFELPMEAYVIARKRNDTP